MLEANVIKSLGDWYRDRKLTTFVPILPVLFSLRGKPYTLDDHFPFEPLFRLDMPRTLVMRTGRQTGKTQSASARILCLTGTIPHFRVLVITPLHEQVLRFSNDALRPLIEDSPMRTHLFTSPGQSGSVLRRELRNRSIIYFSYAFLTVERVRSFSGISLLIVDETQDIDASFLPVILETMSASTEYGMTQYTGTSKTKDNTLEYLWQRSSQAEWIIRCHHCSFFNIPAASFNGGHLEKMIGPDRDDISEERPGLICAKCSQPVNPRLGRWVPRFRDRVASFAGYHVPQPIMPMHYAYREKWKTLLAKQRGFSNYSASRFFQECLGEAYDVATKLVNLPDIQRAACLHRNDEHTAAAVAKSYPRRVLAVDWGGGGEAGVSFTVLAVLGILPNGKIDCIFGKRLLTPHDHEAEAEECRRVFNAFSCDLVVHDYTGAGELRQTIMVHRGLPLAKIMPIWYVRAAAANVINFHPATIQHPRDYWAVDRTRSLQLSCYSIKFGLLRFFAYDFVSPEDPGLLHDFLALIENKIETSRGSDVYTIQKSPNMPDDFAHAVNIGCCALWHLTGSWPNFATIERDGSQRLPDDSDGETGELFAGDY